MAPCRGESPAEMLELDLGGELQTGDVEFCRDRGEETFDDLGGEPNRAHLE